MLTKLPPLLAWIQEQTPQPGFESGLHIKQQLIGYKKEHDVSVAAVQSYTRRLVGEIQRGLESSANAIYRNIEPGPLVRARRLRRHRRKIEEADEQAKELRAHLDEDLQQSSVLILQEKVVNKERKQKIKKNQPLDAVRRDMLQQAQEVKEEALFEDFHARLAQQKEEQMIREQALQKARELQDENEKQNVRKWRMSFWAKESAQRTEEAKQAKEVRAKRLKDVVVEAIERDELQYLERELSGLKSQVEGPSISSESRKLGVYGIPMNSDLEDFAGYNGSHKPGVDDLEVELWSADPITDYEEKVIKQQDEESSQRRRELLYSALNVECQTLRDSMDKMCKFRDDTERDIHQLQNEVQELEMKQLGPPRREALPAEVESNQMIKVHMTKLRTRVRELQHGIEIAEQKRRALEPQMLSLAKEIATHRQVNKETKAELDNENNQRGHLPIVIGRSIAKIEGLADEFTTNPRETFDKVVHASRVKILQGQGEVALKAYKEVIASDRNLFILRMSEEEHNFGLQQSLSKLAEVKDRLMDMNIRHAKQNLLAALQAFFRSEQKLQHIHIHHSGPLEWWTYRQEELCRLVERWGTDLAQSLMQKDRVDETGHQILNLEVLGLAGHAETNTQTYATESSPGCFGVSLARGKVGFVAGSMTLPKRGIWMISLTVSKRSKAKEYTGVKTDSVTIKMGPTPTALTTISTVYNKVNPETGAVLYDINFMFTGYELCYRFEFRSVTDDQNYHMTVETGVYEEKNIPDLEYTDFEQKRVRSSLVYEMQLQAKQGTNRLARLIEELSIAEESTSETFDSKLINDYPQRYDRNIFLRLIRAEILLEKARSEALKRRDFGQQETVLLNMSPRKWERLKASKESYYARKKRSQDKMVTDGLGMIGKRIEVYEQETRKWRKVVVKDCVVLWKESGTQCEVRHKIQLVDDALAALDMPFEIDLTKVRYFEVPVQMTDSRAMKSWKATAELRKSIKSLDLEGAKLVNSTLKLVEAEIRVEEERLVQNRASSIGMVSSSAAQEALALLQSSETKAAINGQEIVILAEMNAKLGEFAAFDKKPTRKEARKVAQKRWVEAYVKAQIAAESAKWDQKAKEVQRANLERGMKFTATKIQLQNEIELKKNMLILEHKHQTQQERDAVIKSARFSKVAWDRAVHHAPFCEHLKTKAWGDAYGKGIRCVQCGKELTKIHEDESQEKGYGTGGDAWLDDAVIKHRKTDALALRTSPDMARVEKERMRLEKERRDMELTEAYFYDFIQLRVLYELDRRHKDELKKSGVFRQGVQWTEAEVNEYLSRKVKEERERREAAGLVVTRIEDYDPLLHLEIPAPTFRAQDEARRAAYEEMRYTISRIANFQRRIAELKICRVELIASQVMYAEGLTYLHKNSFFMVDRLRDMEDDLARTGELLKTHSQMERLWKTASVVLKEAQVALKTAEMKFCGVHEDVKEANEVVLAMQCEVKSLLKQTLLLEIEERSHDIALNDLKARADISRKALAEGQTKVTNIEYKKPGTMVKTPYGVLRVRGYRASDDMIFVSFAFCLPPARGYIHSSVILNLEKAASESERILMSHEDFSMKEMVRLELKRELKERNYMSKEETKMRELIFCETLVKQQQMAIDVAVRDAVLNSTHIVKTSIFIEESALEVEKRLWAKVEERIEEIQNYSGVGKKPRPFTSWEMFKLQRKLMMDIKCEFLKKQAILAEQAAYVKIEDDRRLQMESSFADDLTESFLTQFFREVASESLQEGLQAKHSAERISGILFPKPTHMQYSVYCQLRDRWKERKTVLRQRIAQSVVVLAKLADTAETESKGVQELEAELIKKKLAAIERRRQDEMCARMAGEERLCRLAWKDDLARSLRERRAMAEAEKEMRAYMAALDRLKKYLNLSYAAVGTTNRQAELEEAGIIKSSNAKRAEDVKRGTVERRARKREQEQMEKEEKLSFLLQIKWKQEQARLKMQEEFGQDSSSFLEDGDDDLSSRDSDDDPDEHSSERSTGRSNVGVKRHRFLQMSARQGASAVLSVKKPSASKLEGISLPANWTHMSTIEQKYFLKTQRRLARRQRRVEKVQKREQLKLMAMEKKFLADWNKLYEEAIVSECQLEFENMLLEEELKARTQDKMNVDENVRKMKLLAQRKGLVELKAINDYKKKQKKAEQRTKELNEAREWLTLCQKRAKHRDKLKRTVDSQCLWVDTATVTGFQQRYRTDRLRTRLYEVFFRMLVHSIANRAEIIASERLLLKAQEGLSTNKRQLRSKNDNMKKLWREFQRDEQLRQRRSELGKKMFRKWRVKIQAEAFKGWVRHLLWHKGVREAYTLKYELILRELEVRRLHAPKIEDPVAVTYPQTQIDNPSPIGAPSQGFRSMMARHRERVVQCKECKCHYLEAQNHSLACSYHTGQFLTTCPKSCQHPGRTSQCPAHRRRRWTCCDLTDPGNDGSNGCARRNHRPSEHDPVYDKIMRELARNDTETIQQLDKDLQQARKMDWPKRVYQTRRLQVKKVEDDLQSDKDTAAKFETIKFH